MTRDREIDFTTMRAGTTTRRGAEGRRLRWIAKCPKCGRNGDRIFNLFRADEWRINRHASIDFHHKAHRAGVPGFSFIGIDEHCSVWFTNTEADYGLLTHDELTEYRATVAEIQAAAAAL